MKTKWIAISTVIVCVIVALVLIVSSIPTIMTLPEASADYIALIPLSGTISYTESPLAALSGEILTPSKVEEILSRVYHDPYAKAIVLVINSPGGSAAASEEIYQMVKKLSDRKVVVAYITEYGASGGYYISLPCDSIVASPHALTGSVGAVSVVFNLQGLMDKLGIEVETFKSGRLKDVGSSWRYMTDEEKELLQSLVNDIANLFKDRVMEHRGGKIKDWEDVLTAKPYLGSRAVEVGLVDYCGTLDDAVRIARELGNLSAIAPTRWIKPKAPSLLELILGSFETLKPMKLSYEVLMMWPLPSSLGEYQAIVK